MSQFKVGDRVKALVNSVKYKGKIEAIYLELPHPITVRTKEGDVLTFTIDGRYLSRGPIVLKHRKEKQHD